jgi:hypothetical protein
MILEKYTFYAVQFTDITRHLFLALRDETDGPRPALFHSQEAAETFRNEITGEWK